MLGCMKLTHYGEKFLLINYLTGDATKPIGSSDKIIAHVCNDIGKWGAGFTKALDRLSYTARNSYMELYKYRKTPFIPLGTIDIIGINAENGRLYVCNMIAQHGVYGPLNKQPICYDALEYALDSLNDRIDASFNEPVTIHMPRIGAGLARGDWHVIELILNKTLGDKTVNVYDL